MTNRALTIWANAKFQTTLFEMSISRLLKKKELLNSATRPLTTTKRVRKVWCLEVEQVTLNWFIVMEEKGVILSDDLVIAIAK